MGSHIVVVTTSFSTQTAKTKPKKKKENCHRNRLEFDCKQSEITKYDNNKRKILNTKIYVENPKQKKSREAINKESIMVMEECRIDLRAMCP